MTDAELPPEPPRTGHLREVWLGVFVIAGLISVTAVLMIFTDAALFRGRYILTTVVPSADGIRRNDPVQMRGVNIGRVQRFTIRPDGGVEIRLEIEGEYNMPKDSRVVIKSLGPLQGTVASIEEGKAAEPARTVGTLPGTSERPMGEVAEGIADQIETVLGRVETTLSKDTIEHVQGSTKEMHALLTDLRSTVSEQRKEITALTTSMRKTADEAGKVATNAADLTGKEELKRTIERMDRLSARLEGMTDTLDRSAKSLDTVMGRMERGEGTLGKMSTDPQLYNDLAEASRNLNELLVDLRKNPKRYLKVSVF